MTAIIVAPLLLAVALLAGRRWMPWGRRDFRSIAAHRSALGMIEHAAGLEDADLAGTGENSGHVRVVGQPAARPRPQWPEVRRRRPADAGLPAGGPAGGAAAGSAPGGPDYEGFDEEVFDGGEPYRKPDRPLFPRPRDRSLVPPGPVPPSGGPLPAAPGASRRPGPPAAPAAAGAPDPSAAAPGAPDRREPPQDGPGSVIAPPGWSRTPALRLRDGRTMGRPATPAPRQPPGPDPAAVEAAAASAAAVSRAAVSARLPGAAGIPGRRARRRHGSPPAVEPIDPRFGPRHMPSSMAETLREHATKPARVAPDFDTDGGVSTFAGDPDSTAASPGPVPAAGGAPHPVAAAAAPVAAPPAAAAFPTAPPAPPAAPAAPAGRAAAAAPVAAPPAAAAFPTAPPAPPPPPAPAPAGESPAPPAPVAPPAARRSEIRSPALTFVPADPPPPADEAPAAIPATDVPTQAPPARVPAGASTPRAGGTVARRRPGGGRAAVALGSAAAALVVASGAAVVYEHASRPGAAHTAAGATHPAAGAAHPPAPVPVTPAQSVPSTTVPVPALTPTASNSAQATYSASSSLVAVSITSSRPCWIELRSGPTGPVTYEGILTAASSQTFQTSGGMWLRLGDPVGVQLTINGSPVTLPTAPNPFNVVVSAPTGT